MPPGSESAGGGPSPFLAGMVVVIAILFCAFLFTRLLTTVEAGTIRLVSMFGGRTLIYKGPGKAWEIPLLTTATSIPSQAINIDLDITDQTADRDAEGRPKPIKVNVQASAIVSIGDTQEMILTAANRFFSKPPQEVVELVLLLLRRLAKEAAGAAEHAHRPPDQQRPPRRQPAVARS